MFEWDPKKAALNLKNHGVSFKTVRRFNWDLALEMRDKRFKYPEVRTIAFGFVGSRLFVLVFTRPGTGIRVISFRKANDREARFYGTFTENLGRS